MARQIEEKETQYQSLLKDTELKQIHQYLKGLESERTRLAKELHDNVSNELVAIKCKLKIRQILSKPSIRSENCTIKCVIYLTI